MKAFSEEEIGRNVISVVGADPSDSGYNDPLLCTIGDITPDNINKETIFPTGEAQYILASEFSISSVIISTTEAQVISVSVNS